MVIRKRIWFLFLAAVLLLAGCRRQNAQRLTVVSEITVVCEQDGLVTQQVYTTQWKMRQILNGLRTLGQKFSPIIDPESLSAQTNRITVTYTDGSERIYQTKADRYIRTGFDPWQQADPEKVEALNQLLRNLPGDDIAYPLR